MTSSSAESFVRTPARVALFGFESTTALLTLRRRSRVWRLIRTLRVLGVTAVTAPLAGLVPPHAPWVLGVVGGGLFLARRRWRHRLTVQDLSALCPRCGARLTLPAGTRLTVPLPVPCEGCHHQPTLEVVDDRLVGS